MPKTVPFDLALRCDRDGNVPQVQFNEDGVLHDFVAHRQRIALKCSPGMVTSLIGSVSDFRVQSPADPIADQARQALSTLDLNGDGRSDTFAAVWHKSFCTLASPCTARERDFHSLRRLERPLEGSSGTPFGDFLRRLTPPRPHVRSCSACAGAALRPPRPSEHGKGSRAAPRSRPRVPFGPLPAPPVRCGRSPPRSPDRAPPPSPTFSCRQICCPAPPKWPVSAPARHVLRPGVAF